MRRTVFTLLSVLAAFLLFGLLQSVRSTFEVAGQSVAGVDRLITVSKIGFIESLPKKLLPRIAAVPGVTRVSYANWFGGIYRDPKNFFGSEAIPDSFLDFHPEWRLSPDQRRAFHNIRTGAIVGEALARKFNWKLGDRISLLASGLPQKNGSNTWTFNLVGIYRVTEPNLKSQENALYFNWDYFDLARQVGNDSVGWFLVDVADRRQAQRVAQEIDALSANSDHETKTQSEQPFNAATLEQTGTDDTAIIIRGGAQTEINSVVDHLSATVVSQAPQVLGSDRGYPIASPELVVVASLPKKSSGLDTNVEVRGVGERVWELRPNIKVIAGRKFIWGMREVMAGKGAREQFSGLELGSAVRLNGQTWTVVGAFDAGDSHNSEIWGDAAVVGSAYRRGSSTNSITVRLRDAGSFDAFKARLASDPRLKVDVKTTRDYYSQQSESTQ